VFVADIQPSTDEVLELARLVTRELAEKLHTAVDRQTTVLALTVPERELILWALDDAPDGLAELRGVLLQEHTWRKREGLT
jgi:hypothetical protein